MEANALTNAVPLPLRSHSVSCKPSLMRSPSSPPEPRMNTVRSQHNSALPHAIAGFHSLHCRLLPSTLGQNEALAAVIFGAHLPVSMGNFAVGLYLKKRFSQPHAGHVDSSRRAHYIDNAYNTLMPKGRRCRVRTMMVCCEGEAFPNYFCTAVCEALTSKP